MDLHQLKINKIEIIRLVSKIIKLRSELSVFEDQLNKLLADDYTTIRSLIDPKPIKIEKVTISSQPPKPQLGPLIFGLLNSNPETEYTKAIIAKALNMPAHNQIHTYLSKLAKEDKIIKVAKGVYKANHRRGNHEHLV